MKLEKHKPVLSHWGVVVRLWVVVVMVRPLPGVHQKSSAMQQLVSEHAGQQPHSLQEQSCQPASSGSSGLLLQLVKKCAKNRTVTQQKVTFHKRSPNLES